MTLAIRLGGPTDADRVIATDPHAASGGERAEEIRTWVAEGCCLLAEEDGAIAGFTALTRGFFHAPFVELLFVAASARRRGVGLALLRECMARTASGEKLWTSTNESNTPMQRLLARAGFIRSGIVENLDEGDPELIYVRLPSAPEGDMSVPR